MSWRQLGRQYSYVRQRYRRAKKQSTRNRIIGDLIGWASR